MNSVALLCDEDDLTSRVADALVSRGADVAYFSISEVGSYAPRSGAGLVLLPSEHWDIETVVVGLNAAASRSGAQRIVVVVDTSALGWLGSPRRSARNAALVGASRSLALELAPSGVTVNVVVHSLDDESGPVRQGLRSTASPLGIETSADDVAACVLFLLDERSGYITGQTLFATGGSQIITSFSA